MIRFLLAVLALAGPAQADPLLSIAGTFDDTGDYDVVLAQLADVGADATAVSLFWDEMEVDGRYEPPFDWPAISNLVYPPRGLQVQLMISVVDTVADRRPADLLDRPFDDPVVIARFTAFLTAVLQRMPNVTLTSIGIGNEVDGVLTPEERASYAIFFDAARDTMHQLRPGVPVGMTITYGGFTGPDAAAMQALANHGDVWMLNYYPLGAGFEIDDPATVATALSGILDLAGDKPVLLTEAGYPSGGCGASDQGQVAFVQNVLEFAAAQATRMPLVTLVWLHDLPPDQVAGYVTYYGVPGDCFARYLATLGLRRFDGTDKPAFAWLRERAR